jgi:type I restriction enzyme S subunit
MKLKTFFEKFDQFADAPDAVAKMRELVLNLAVQGRLVSNSSENPLSAEQIASEKQRRLRELNIRSHPDTPRPTESDFPFNLPDPWHAVTLGDLAFSCPTSYGEDPVPSLPKAGVVKVGNIDNQGGFKGHFSERGFPPDEIESLLARRGDLMVVKSSGSAENVHSGKTALCTAEHDGKIVGSNFVLRLRLLGTPAVPEYVWRVLTSRYSRAWVEGTVQTMTYPNLKWSDFARLPIPLPPLPEQKRIVAKVDELMALCDRLEAQQQERETRHAALARASLARFANAPTPANLLFLFHPSYAIPAAELRKSILTLAVQGKLVSQDPDDEPADVTFPKLAAVAIEADEDEFPAHWLRVPLGKTGEWRGGGTPSKSRPEFWKGDLPWVSPKDMKVLHVADAQDHISPAAVEGSSVRLIPPGSLLMVVRGMILARAFPVALTMREVTINQDMKALLPSEPRTKEYLLVALRAFEPDVLAAIERSSHGTCKLKTEFLQDFVMPIPPLAEQRRIVAKVDELMALVDSLENQLTSARVVGQTLLAALVPRLRHSGC